MFGKRNALAVCVALGTAFLSPLTHAGDGRIEINQSRALAGGITPGDAPGFPVQITQPGSYLLTGDLVVTGEFSEGIDIESDNVSLDLNGFSMTGPVVCNGQGSAVDCPQPPLGGIGIDARSTRGVIVRNGMVRGFRGAFVGGQDCIVTNLTALQNRFNGIQGGRRCIVKNSIANFNSFSGVTIDGHGLAWGNTAQGNGEAGLRTTGAGSVIVENSTRINGLEGINAGFAGNLVADNTADQNEGDGIAASAGSLVSGIAGRENGDFQLSLGSSAGYSRSVLTTAPGSTGLVEGTGTFMSQNLCDGSPLESICQP